MVGALAIILLFQLAGEVISRAGHLPLPGPVLGMVGLVVALSVSTRLRELIRPTAQGVLQNLSLLFVPAGVGVVAHMPTLANYGLALAVSLVVSTLLAIVVGAVTFTWVARLVGSRADD
ncbi:CidA/LrgA family protein [Sinirhodobacter sp. WL0062]|uniref:CidA/LrgA family protein n=1 Tax=Rhodobacter flavimaris TaxID=2907145 RepID=A0ABS8YU80_9RHOB|nr:CidA/LrgA family protein [Sinirhodobacter sp. WL0062]MCE5973407.1 CidA/LrgA family protein [Sinirhodobacter sp. WL0062]